LTQFPSPDLSTGKGRRGKRRDKGKGKRKKGKGREGKEQGRDLAPDVKS